MVIVNVLVKIYVKIGYTLFMLVGLAMVLATGCTPLRREVIPTTQAEPVYDQLYPYYVELCTVSQIRAKFAQHGGSPGHAVMYLKGVCRNTATEYPTIEVCDSEAVDLSDPETGVGISVNKHLNNVNWIAVPGKQLFYRGNLEEDQLLNESHVRETVLHVVDEVGIIRRCQSPRILREKHSRR